MPELLANLQFRPQPASGLLTQPERRGNELFFPIPVEDFAFSLHDLTAEPQALGYKERGWSCWRQRRSAAGKIGH